MRFLFKAALYLASLIPARAAFRFSTWIASLGGSTQTAKVTAINLGACFPELAEDEIQKLTRKSLAHMVFLFFEFAQLRFWPSEKLLADVSFNAEEVFIAAKEEHRGVLLLVPHFGNWELLAAYLGIHHSVAALYDPPRVAALESEIVAAREGYGGEMFPIGIAGMRSVLKELRKGGIVALLPDQVPPRDAGEYAPFFGQPALTMHLPQQLKEKTNCEVVVGSVQRCIGPGGISYQVSFTPIAESPTPEVVNRVLEDVIKAAPEQYQWEYKRFKRPPKLGKDNIYRRQ